MKKIIALFVSPVILLSAVIVSFTGCKKENNKEAEIPKDPNIDILYRKKIKNASGNELWITHIDGTNNGKMGINLPEGYVPYSKDMAEISKDGYTLLVMAYKPSLDQFTIFKSGLNGFNPEPVGSLNQGENMGIIGWADNASIIYSRHSSRDGRELWRINTDGSNRQKINITLPFNTYFGEQELARVTPGNTPTIVFTALVGDNVNQVIYYALYKCNLDGSNLKQITTIEPGYTMAIQDLPGGTSVLYRRAGSTVNTNELWQVNLDGTNKRKLNVALPAGVSLSYEEMAKTSADGSKLFVLTTTDSQSNNYNGHEAIYSADINGSNVKLVTQITNGYSAGLQCLLEK